MRNSFSPLSLDSSAGEKVYFLRTSIRSRRPVHHVPRLAVALSLRVRLVHDSRGPGSNDGDSPDPSAGDQLSTSLMKVCLSIRRAVGRGQVFGVSNRSTVGGTTSKRPVRKSTLHCNSVVLQVDLLCSLPNVDSNGGSCSEPDWTTLD